MNEWHSVTVVIVNYNGAHFLPICLDPLKRQTYPADRFEVVVSDNGSTDDSIEILRNQYPWVGIRDNKKNLGFAAGNNVVFREVNSEFLVMLNNDTAPHETWLENLVKIAQENPRAGVVTSHIHLFYNYLLLELISDNFSPKLDNRSLGLKVYEIESDVSMGVYQYLDGFYGWEIDEDGKKFRWTTGNALIGLPVPLASGDFKVRLKFAGHKQDKNKKACKVTINGLCIDEWLLDSSGIVDRCFTIPEDLRVKAVPAVQNTGSIIFKNGMSRDRGTYVNKNEAFFEFDQGQYSNVEEVFAGCGAGMLLRNEMLTDIGLLDDSFFMYYEDTDLCWRARLRNWIVLYSPKAVVRHIHCGTMTEWSPLFQYFTERNRLAMVFKNGSSSQVILVWIGFFWGFLKAIGATIKSVAMHKPEWRTHVKRLWNNLNVLVRLMVWKPKLCWERHYLQRKRLVPHEMIETWFRE